MRATSHPVQRLAGALRAPGDKSCSHRALMLGAVADGTTHISGLLEGDDVLNTARSLERLGASLKQTAPGAWTVVGVGEAGFKAPDGDLDCGNSGTGARLMMGLVAGHCVEARFIGDASLSSRPMGRVLEPLRQMGARVLAADGGRLPVTIKGGGLNGVRYAPPQASAQVKSCLLLAGLRADGETVIEEKAPTRDHTERMLAGFGVAVSVSPRDGAGPVVSLKGGPKLTGAAVNVPSDPSSAAFLAAAASIVAQGDVRIDEVMDNPTRSGVFDVLTEMGALSVEQRSEGDGEAWISWRARSTPLKAISPSVDVIPAMIDELPIYAVLAAFSDGECMVRGAEELRVKESDRIAATVDMLRVNGVEAEELPDGFIVQGLGAGGVPGGGVVETRHDHRIAMSALVMGCAAQQPVSVNDTSMIATSYPEFFDQMASLGAHIETERVDA